MTAWGSAFAELCLALFVGQQPGGHVRRDWRHPSDAPERSGWWFPDTARQIQTNSLSVPINHAAYAHHAFAEGPRVEDYLRCLETCTYVL